MVKHDLGINKFEAFVLFLTLRKKLDRLFDTDDDEVAFEDLFKALSEFITKVGQKADKPWRGFFSAQAQALMQLSTGMKHHGGMTMAKIDLGLTTKELLSLIPELIGEIWPHYNDDQKISADEGILIAAAMFRALSDPTDDPFVKEFFASQADAFEALAPLFASEEDEE